MLNNLKKPTEMTERHSWAETGTALFACLNVISACFGVLICLIVLCLYIQEAVTHTGKIDTFMWSACLSTNLLAVVTLLFAVLLYLGINQKKPCLVLAYFIFGVILMISMVTGLVVLQLQSSDSNIYKTLREVFCEYYEPIIYATFGICIVYALLLTMICRTWFLLTRRRSQDHVKLVNDYYESDWRNN